MLNKLSSHVLIPIVLLALVLGWIGVSQYWFEPNPSEFRTYSIVSNEFSLITKIVIYLLGSLLSLGIIIRINALYRFVEGGANSIGAFFMLGLLIFPATINSVSAVITQVSLLLSLQLLLKVYNQPSVIGELFLASMLIGVACLFFYPAVIFLLIVFIAIALFRPFELRNFMISLIGLLLPAFYWFSFDYLLTDSISMTELQEIRFNIGGLSKLSIPFLLFTLLALISVLRLFAARSKFVVRQRNQLFLCLFFLMATGLIFLIVPVGTALFVFLGPVSLFFSYLYKKSKRKWTIDLFLLVLLVSFALLKF